MYTHISTINKRNYEVICFENRQREQVYVLIVNIIENLNNAIYIKNDLFRVSLLSYHVYHLGSVIV